MRKIYLLLLAVCFATVVNAQLTGTKNIPGDYATLAAAITDLNTQGVGAGGVIFNLVAGNPQTAPAGGYVIGGAGSLVLTTTSATNTITFQGNSNVITAFTPQTSGALNDGIFKLIGADWVTISGFTLQENAANTTTAAATNNMTEWAIALLYVTTTDGSQNNTIQNNTISLNRSYSNTFGVYSNTRHSSTAVTTAADVTTAGGSNSNNKVYSNTISNVDKGVVFVGANTAVAMDNGNDVGGSSAATGNTFTNWGGLVSGAMSGYTSVTSSSTCIQMNDQVGDNVSFNTLTSATNITTLTTTGFIGIFKSYSFQPTGLTFTSNYNSNTVTMTNAPTTSQLTGMGMQGLTTLATATFNCNNNNILNCAYTGATVGAATMIGMLHSSAPGTFNINGNTVRGFTTTTTTTGGFVGIQQQTNGVVNTLNINNNKIGDATAGAVTFNNTTTTAAVTGIAVTSTGAASTCALSMTGNDIRGITYVTSGTGAHLYISNAAVCLSQNISNNTFTNLNVNTTGNVTFISNSVAAPAAGFKTINNNSIVTAFNKGGAGGTVALYTDGASSVCTTPVQNNNNNFSNITVTGATAITGWFNNDGTGGTPLKVMTGNTFNNWVCGTGTVTVFQSNFGNPTTMTGNTVTNITGQGIITGINVGSSGTYNSALSLSSNTVTGLSSTGTGGAVTGISFAAPAPVTGTNTVSANTINTLSSSSTTATVAGIASSGSNVNISNHTIFALSCVGTTSGVTNGIMVTAGNNVSVFKNKIYDLTTSGAFTTTPGVNGIVLSGSASASTYSVFNNLVGDLKAPAASSTDAIRGISVTATGTTSTYNVYYNSVNISATSTGANFGTSGIFHAASATATTAALVLRNNIIVNNSTAAGTGVVTVFRRSVAATLGNYGAASNNNDFYSSTGSVMHDGTTAFTIVTYKAAVAPRDAASFTEDPEYQSTVGSSADFLKYKTTSAKQVESGAVNITGITDDYIGTIRQGNGGYAGTGIAPDMGGWELEGIGADLTGPVITYTALGNTLCLTDRTLSATITDASSVNVTAGTKPRLYYKKSTDANTYVGNTSADNGWKYVEATNAASPFSFTTDYTLLQSAVAPGDIIQYFVVAQDLAATPNVGINSGTFAAAPSSVALTSAAFPLGGTINSYTLLTGIPTSVTIGAAGTYPSLTGVGGLFADLNTKGLTGNTTVTIIDASVTETGANALNAISYGCAGTYTLTIKPQTTATLTGSVAAGAIIKLNGADNVIIDGSNSGGTDRSLTIENTTTTTSGNAVVWLASPAAGNGATNNTIKNCIIQGNASTTTFTGVHIGGSTTIGLTTGGTELNSNNTINNNLFRKTQYGATLFGFAAASPDQNNVISNNNFGTAVTGEGFSLLAINADRQQGLVVSGNDVQNVRNATNTSSTPYGGIRLLDFKNGLCFNNKVHDLDYTGTSTPKIYGIAMTNSTYTTAGNPSNAQIYNNVVYKINSTGTSAVWNMTGILASAGYGDKIYYNSVHLTGQVANSSSGLVAAFANGDGNITSVCTNIDVRNNSFSLTGSSAVAGGNFWAYYSAATTLAGSTLNYNDLYCNGTNATNNVGRFNGTSYTTLAAWQTATGQEANSIAADPLYNSTTSLIPQLGSPLVAAATPIGGITTDILGTVRSVTTPTIGAYETAVDAAGPVITYVALTSTCATGNRTLTASITDASGVPVAGAGLPVLYWRINAGAWTAATGTFVSGSNYSFTFGSGAVFPDVVQYYVVAQDNAGVPNVSAFPSAGAGGFTANPPAAATPPTTPSSYSIQSSLAPGTYTVGAAGTYPTLAAAFNAYNTSCLSGPIVFSLIDASYTNTSDTLKANPDASAVNTLTIKPNLASTTITGNSAAAPIVLFGADYITIDGSISNTVNSVCPASSASRDLTIINTNTGTSSAVVSINTTAGGDAATNNTVKNCIITGNSNTTTLAGINISGTAIGSGAGANFNNNNAVVNNSVSKTVIGIFTAGSAIATKSANTVINQNVMTTSGANSIGRFGIMSLLEDNITVSGNAVSGIVNSASVDVGGICVGSNGGFSTTTVSGGEVTNATITNNVIGTVQQTATFSAMGIAVLSGTTGTTLVANNMLSGVNANGTSGDFSAGILLAAGVGATTNVYHNSVTMTGTLTGGAYPTYAFAIHSTNPAVNLKNNIFTSTGSTGANLNRAIGLNFVLPASNLVSNNNDLFVSGTGAVVAQTTTLASTGGVTHTALLDWQTNSGQDANSKNVAPTFTSATDLHLVTPDAVNFNNLESTGATVGVGSDIDCQSRPNGTAPDIGADEFVGALPACNTPTAVAVGSITTTTASVSFTCTGCTGTYIVEYGLPGFTPGTGATAGTGGTVVPGAASPIALSGLTPATTYDVYVRQVCIPGSSYSTNSAVVSFTTLCNALNLPYTENFDAVTPPAIPICSSKEDVNGATTWNTSTTNPRSTPNNLTYNWDLTTPGDDWWYTPGLNLTGGVSYRLTFWYRARSSSFPEALEVKYGTAQSAGTMTLGTLFSNTSITTTTYTQATADFTPASTGVYYIGFHDISLANEFDLHVDDINVDATPLCPAPTSLSVGTITSSSAIASWTGSGTFILEYGLTGFTPGTGATAGTGGTVINPATSPQTISGLASSTAYQFYVRQNCTGAGNGYSTNAGPVAFTTLAAPPANDDAPGAITLTVGAGCTGSPYTNLAATQSAGEPYAACKGTAGFNTVWFKFVAPTSGAVKVSNDISGGTMGSDSRMALFSTTNVNDYTTFTNIACDDDNGVTLATRSILYATGLTPGNTYYVQVDGFSSTTTQGTFCVTVDEMTSSMVTTNPTCATSGQSLSAYNDNYSGWISAVDGSGNLVAQVSNLTGGAGTSTISNSNNINTAAVRSDAVTGQKYLDRSYFLNSSTVTNANVRFFFLNTELTALQAADGAVTLANLQATRQTGTTCAGDFIAAGGTNTSLSQTANGTGTGFSWVQVNTPGFSNFYLHTAKSFIPVKTWLQGAYNTGLARHKDVTAAWAAVLNANALNQPYNTPAFGNYAGTESVSAGFFTSTAGTTDVLDWVLLEVRDQTTPSTIITRKAAFIREDGRIVDLDGTTDVSFRNLANNNYFVVIRHRNHLPIRSSVTQATNGTMGIALPSVYDFSTGQAQAFQDGAIVTNAAMVNLGASGVFGMWGGNANANTNVRYTGLNNDAGAILTALGGNQSAVLTNVYNIADLNMDGTLRYTGLNNDVGFLLSVLGGVQSAVFTQHQ